MTVVESRVRQGVLTIDGVDHSCQPTAVSIQPANTEGTTGNELEVLCGDKLTDAGEAGGFDANLVFTAIQDFTNTAGLIAQSWMKNGETLDFIWQSTNNTTDSWRGKVQVQALEVGGEVGARLTNQATWKITELFLPTRLGGTQVIPAIAKVVPITGVAAGIPGTFAPGTAIPPADMAALKAHGTIGDSGTGKPAATVWTTGQYVTLGDASFAYWSGTAWTVGKAP